LDFYLILNYDARNHELKKSILSSFLSVCCNLLLLSGLHNNTLTNTRFACHAMLIKKTEVVDLLTLQ